MTHRPATRMLLQIFKSPILFGVIINRSCVFMSKEVKMGHIFVILPHEIPSATVYIGRWDDVMARNMG